MSRPTKYNPKTMPAKVIAIMKDGGSKIEVAAALGVNRDTLYEWCKQHPEFSDTVKKGEQLSQAWWEKQGRINLTNKDFNSTLWYMNMKNRHGWRDHQNLDIKSSSEVSYKPIQILSVKNRPKSPASTLQV